MLLNSPIGCWGIIYFWFVKHAVGCIWVISMMWNLASWSEYISTAGLTSAVLSFWLIPKFSAWDSHTHAHTQTHTRVQLNERRQCRVSVNVPVSLNLTKQQISFMNYMWERLRRPTWMFGLYGNPDNGRSLKVERGKGRTGGWGGQRGRLQDELLEPSDTWVWKTSDVRTSHQIKHAAALNRFPHDSPESHDHQITEGQRKQS